MKEKKCFFKPIVLIVFAMNVLSFFIATIGRNMEKTYTYTYVDGSIVTDNGMGGFIIGGYVYAAIVVILLIIALIQVIQFRKEMAFIFNLMIVICLVPISLFVIRFGVKSVINTDDGYTSACYEFSKDEKTIVLCEKKLENDSYVDVYQLGDGNEAIYIDYLETFDGYTNDGKYKITWYDNKVAIQYSVDGNGFEMSYELKLVK